MFFYNKNGCVIESDLKLDFPVVSADEVEQGYDGALYVKGFAPEKPQELINAERIAELKQLLEGSDYKAIKYAEGLVSEEEYAKTKAQRQAWREELNSLGV